MTSHTTLAQARMLLAQHSQTSEALVTRSLAQAAATPHVMTRIYAEAALEAARATDRQRQKGATLGPLAGLPVTIKDLFDVQGETTMAGTIVCAGEPAAQADAPVVARLRQAGAVILGKTNMSEFAFSGIGINPHYGTPVNPADPSLPRIPGGSSSGAAVSVASGFALAGLGSDTGGSLRIPAALCGLVGFKNSQFRVPRQGAVELARSLDTVGAITRCVSDAQVIDGVLSGAPLAVPGLPVQGLRLAVPDTLVLDELDDTVAAAFARVLSSLSAKGVQVTHLPLSELSEIVSLNAPGGLSPIEGYAAQSARIEPDPSRVDHRVVQRMMLGKGVTAKDYLHLLDARKDWITRVQARINDFDAVICPTTPWVAHPIEPLLTSDEAFFKVNRLMLRNTFAFNFLDACSISMPCHRGGELPVGLMLSAACGRDAHLLGVALALEGLLQASAVS